MNLPNSKEQDLPRDIEINEWRERSPVERRTECDSRRRKNLDYLKKGGRERRTGKERRETEERRDRWLRVSKWRSESVFDE